MSTIRTTQPKRKLNLSPITVRVLSSADLDSMWGAGAPHNPAQPPKGGDTRDGDNPTTTGQGCSSTGTRHHPRGDDPANPPPNQPPPQRGDGGA